MTAEEEKAFEEIFEQVKKPLPKPKPKASQASSSQAQFTQPVNKPKFTKSYATTGVRIPPS